MIVKTLSITTALVANAEWCTVKNNTDEAALSDVTEELGNQRSSLYQHTCYR